MDRDQAIERIRKALRARSGKSWSVKGGRGTSYGWITIDVPPAREAHRTEELKELARLMNVGTVHYQGMDIPASHDYRQEAVDRAEGRTPTVVGTPYWD